jgi:hypothetical protein
VDLPVLEGLVHQAEGTLLVPVLVALVAGGPEAVAKVLPEAPVRLEDAVLGVLDGDVAGHLVEELAVAGLALVELPVQLLHLRDVGGHLLDGDDLAGVVGDRRRSDEQPALLAVEADDALLAGMAAAVGERALDGARVARLGATLVHLVAAAAAPRAEVAADEVVRLDQAQLAVLHRDVAGHLLEVPPVLLAHDRLRALQDPCSTCSPRILRRLRTIASAVTGLSTYPSGGGTGRS